MKAGEPAEKAERLAQEEAEAFAKGSYVPHVIEPSAGVDRLLLALLCHAFDEEEVTDEKGKKETAHRAAFSPARGADQGRHFPAAQEQARARGKRRSPCAICCGRT